MSELLTGGTMTDTSLKGMRKQREDILKNWEDSGLLDGLTDGKKINIAQLMESEAQHLLNETVTVVTYSSDTIPYPLLPVAVKVEPHLLALDNKWYVYILECGDGSYYTGITNDLDKRILTHNKGKGAKYTRSRLPVVLKCSCEVWGKSEAAKLEYKVKKQPRNKKIEFLRSSTCTPYFLNSPIGILKDNLIH